MYFLGGTGRSMTRVNRQLCHQGNSFQESTAGIWMPYSAIHTILQAEEKIFRDLLLKNRSMTTARRKLIPTQTVSRTSWLGNEQCEAITIHLDPFDLCGTQRYASADFKLVHGQTNYSTNWNILFDQGGSNQTGVAQSPESRNQRILCWNAELLCIQDMFQITSNPIEDKCVPGQLQIVIVECC